jgi:hypothetical protein
MHDVSLPAADFGAKPDTCRNPPLPHTFDRFSLKHTRVMGLPFFFWRVHMPAMCQTIDDSTRPTVLSGLVELPSDLTPFGNATLPSFNSWTVQSIAGRMRHVGASPHLKKHKQHSHIKNCGTSEKHN